MLDPFVCAANRLVRGGGVGRVRGGTGGPFLVAFDSGGVNLMGETGKSVLFGVVSEPAECGVVCPLPGAETSSSSGRALWGLDGVRGESFSVRVFTKRNDVCLFICEWADRGEPLVGDEGGDSTASLMLPIEGGIESIVAVLLRSSANTSAAAGRGLLVTSEIVKFRFNSLRLLFEGLASVLRVKLTSGVFGADRVPRAEVGGRSAASRALIASTSILNLATVSSGSGVENMLS